MSKLKPCPFHNCLTCACVDEVNISITDWNTRPIEDALNARIAELEEENDRLQDGWFRDETICPDGSLKPKVSTLLSRIAELSQAVGLITTLKPTMVMDANHPLDMVREVGEHVTARIAELEAAQRWIPVSERLPEKGNLVIGITDYCGYVFFEIVDDDGQGIVMHPYRRCQGKITHWMPLPTPPEVK